MYAVFRRLCVGVRVCEVVCFLWVESVWCLVSLPCLLMLADEKTGFQIEEQEVWRLLPS